ncbi:mRNA interferase RelE/StbE [Allochromatium warmingii]|uniref:mRNA interferase RelE/StbE n=1 Tax=Allochromatium warmingii TaxID=61595 RepID=A0A1H3FEX2_ALLWA|nr:type II toxin-antitoxin system RelE/ParE family toxin [Allochromatium warmingii]SDX89480.1 mRNA interferase RelE/StbE [Allochromatium warmingii]
MSYELAFHPAALKEWAKLDTTIRTQFKKKLAERLLNPRVPAAQLAGHCNRYKIKLRTVGYRLVYIVLVVAIGKRERHAVYQMAIER